jgi:hypothetical protein
MFLARISVLNDLFWTRIPLLAIFVTGTSLLTNMVYCNNDSAAFDDERPGPEPVRKFGYGSHPQLLCALLPRGHLLRVRSHDLLFHDDEG